MVCFLVDNPASVKQDLIHKIQSQDLIHKIQSQDLIHKIQSNLSKTSDIHVIV
jgi:hypothetical protein